MTTPKPLTSSPIPPANRHVYSPRLLLALGDLLVLLAFFAYGQYEHGLIDQENPLMGLLMATGLFAVVWLGAAIPLGAFPPGATLSVRLLLTRTVTSWLVAAPLAVLLRALVLGRAVIPTLFLLVTVALGGAFLLGWRLLFALGWRRWAQRGERGRATHAEPLTAPGSQGF